MDRMNQAEFTCSVQPSYLEEQSDPSCHEYAFAYTVTIVNSGTVAAQLIARHWVITDAMGHTEEVRGLGVVGEQPLLQPGMAFEYTSGCALATPVGTMKGSYQMVGADGTRFDAEIPEFVLAVPHVLH